VTQGGTPGNGEKNRSSGDVPWKEIWAVTASIIAVLGFFGITNFGGLTHQLFPPSPTTTTTTDSPRTDALRIYVQGADNACSDAVRKGDAVPWVNAVTVSWMNQILSLRQQMLADWKNSDPGAGAMYSVDAQRVYQTWADFAAADAYWAAMSDDIYSQNRADYNANLGRYTSTERQFVSEATGCGLTVCSHDWQTVNPW
jgi:hypothetical protein